uniref:PEP-CTERM sorting domain-containing protein n=1 Tax=Thaumasiovibrio occultus TaxID=1891184 RepID=UPI000B35977F|nr:PEP-CTERM sorting domain-containing protein [Thaumasiovibrio occultus]
MKAITGLLVLLFTGSASATIIDFTGMSTALGQTSYSEDGFDITPNSGTLSAFDNDNVPDAFDAPALLVNGGSPASITLSKTNGDDFSLQSFWGAEGRNNDTGFFSNFASAGVTVEGFFSAGGSIVEQIDFDFMALNDSANDFEFFELSGFNGLSSVVFTGFGAEITTGYSFQIDTLTLDSTPIPEPASLAFLSLGLLGFGLSARKARNANQ